MKHIAISLIILSVLLIFSLLTSNHISAVVDQTTIFLERASKEENRALAESLVDGAAKYWKKHQSGFGMLLRHDEVDEVICEMALLQAYAHREDWDDFDGNCACLLARLQHIKEMQNLTMHNVL